MLINIYESNQHDNWFDEDWFLIFIFMEMELSTIAFLHNLKIDHKDQTR